jgi:phosphoglycolate phosphatase
MTIKAVVFDLDGTIVSFNIDYMAVRADVRGFLIKTGMPASVLSANESIFEMLKKAEIFLKNHGKAEKAIDKVRHESSGIAEKYEYEAAKTTSLLPGVVETLKSLRKMKLKLGLCTINSEKSTKYILERFGLTRFFDAVTPRNDVKYVKPNTEHLEATLKALDILPNEVLLVGDGARDMQCARELNVIAVGLPSEVCSRRQLEVAGANYLVTTITDLPVLLENLNTK